MAGADTAAIAFINTVIIVISAVSNVIVTTEITSFADATSNFNPPHESSNFLDRKYVVDLEKDLVEQATKMINELEKCSIETIIFGRCIKAEAIYRNAQDDLFEHEKQLTNHIIKLKQKIDYLHQTLLYLGVENQSLYFNELSIAKNRFESPEKTENATSDLESQVMYMNNLVDLLNTTESLGVYVSLSNTIINSISTECEELNKKIAEEVSVFESDLKELKKEFNQLTTNLNSIYYQIQNEDFSVLDNSATYMKKATVVVEKDQIKEFLREMEGESNDFSLDEKHKTNLWLKNSLEFYNNVNEQIKETINLYEFKKEKLNSELLRLENEFDRVDLEIKKYLLNPSKFETKSEKIKVLKYNLELVEDYSEKINNFEKQKKEIEKQIYLLEKSGIDVSFEKLQLSKLKEFEFDEISYIKNSLFKKENEYSQQFLELKEKFNEKRLILSKININFEGKVETIKELEENIAKMNILIQEKGKEFVKVSEKLFLTEKPICNTEVSYKKIYEIENQADIEIKNYITPNKNVITLFPKEIKLIENEEKFFIKCTLKSDVINANQDFKTVYEKIEIETIFEETLIPKNQKITLSTAENVDDYQDFWVVKENNVEIFYEDQVNIKIEKTTYQMGNKTKYEISLTNLDLDFQKFTYKIQIEGNASCKNCYILGNILVFEIKNFKKGENKVVEFEIIGNVIKSSEHLGTNLESFEKDYQKEYKKYKEQKEKEILKSTICLMIECNENFEQETLNELKQKTLLEDLENKIENATNNGIKIDTKKLVELKNLDITNLNETKKVIQYYSVINELEKEIITKLEQIKEKASEKLVLAKEKFEEIENKNVIYDYLETAVSSFEDGKYTNSIENSEKILAFKEEENFGWLWYAIIGLAILCFGIFIFKNKKQTRPLQKKILKLFDEEI